MRASTVQFSTNNQPPPQPPRQTPPTGERYEIGAIPEREATARPAQRAARSLRTQQRAYDHHPAPPTPLHPPRRSGHAVLGAGTRPAAELVSVPPSSTTPHTRPAPADGHRIHDVGAALHRRTGSAGDVLLRKEVIQPHLPVRLPCYDFVPIADPAF